MLLEFGLRTTAVYATDEQSLRKGLLDAGRNVLAWPVCYTIGADPEGALLVDFLDAHEVSYVGASSRSLFLNSKIALKEALADTEFATPSYVLLPGESAVEGAALTFPWMLKTEFTCNSEGVRYARNAKEAATAFRDLDLLYAQRIFAETWIRHREYTVAYLPTPDGALVGAIEMIPKAGKSFVDQEAKRDNRYLEFAVPHSSRESAVVSLVKALAVGFPIDGHFRLDVVENAQGDLHVIDLNFLPGLNDIDGQWSYFPLALRMCLGVSFRQTVLHVLRHALERADQRLAARIDRFMTTAADTDG